MPPSGIHSVVPDCQTATTHPLPCPLLPSERRPSQAGRARAQVGHVRDGGVGKVRNRRSSATIFHAYAPLQPAPSPQCCLPPPLIPHALNHPPPGAPPTLFPSSLPPYALTHPQGSGPEGATEAAVASGAGRAAAGGHSPTGNALCRVSVAVSFSRGL